MRFAPAQSSAIIMISDVDVLKADQLMGTEKSSFEQMDERGTSSREQPITTMFLPVPHFDITYDIRRWTGGCDQVKQPGGTHHWNKPMFFAHAKHALCHRVMGLVACYMEKKTLSTITL